MRNLLLILLCSACADFSYVKDQSAIEDSSALDTLGSSDYYSQIEKYQMRRLCPKDGGEEPKISLAYTMDSLVDGRRVEGKKAGIMISPIHLFSYLGEQTSQTTGEQYFLIKFQEGRYFIPRTDLCFPSLRGRITKNTAFYSAANFSASRVAEVPARSVVEIIADEHEGFKTADRNNFWLVRIGNKQGWLPWSHFVFADEDAQPAFYRVPSQQVASSRACRHLTLSQTRSIFAQYGLPTDMNFLKSIFVESFQNGDGFYTCARGCNNSSCSNRDLGLMQVNVYWNFRDCFARGIIASEADLYDPHKNARCARATAYAHNGKSAWHTWNNGLYRNVRCAGDDCWKI